jgi:hypothetical protein
MAVFSKKGTGTTCLRQNDTSLSFFRMQGCGLAGWTKFRAEIVVRGQGLANGIACGDGYLDLGGKQRLAFEATMFWGF